MRHAIALAIAVVVGSGCGTPCDPASVIHSHLQGDEEDCGFLLGTATLAEAQPVHDCVRDHVAAGTASAAARPRSITASATIDRCSDHSSSSPPSQSQ